MAGGVQLPRSDKPSIKYRSNLLEGAFFELTDFDSDPTSSSKDKQNATNSEPKSRSILSTAELISSVGQIWNCATRPLSFFQPKKSSKYNNADLQKADMLRSSTSCECQFISVDSITTCHSSHMVRANLDCLQVTKNMPFFQPYCGDDLFSETSGQNSKSVTKNASITFPSSDDFLQPAEDIVSNGNVSKFPISAPHADRSINDLASVTCAYEERKCKTEGNDLHGYIKNQQKAFIVDQSRYAFAKQEHAFAGAFAGIFVSVCLHPVDTIKTVIQSCHNDQNSLQYISRSIISERGVTGLYRGISSNIASSAPISAVYTFTYESVKEALLPHFPKEYHSLAHCMAGGCASIATSFIFTPSERIKQQMQVGSHYQNCWKALIGIIGKGGLSSLYTGWGAVLCRNVPHSIIKFYTYESLKQLMLSTLQSNAQLNTLQTLVCGGLAGSTAALFTTPFDVVKTRLQTEIPGSLNQYDGVFNTLKEIAKHEGLNGLYRGLTPRLVMYMTQGAIFFASYESFKRLFSLEEPHLDSRTIQYEQKVEENDFTSLSKTA